MRHHAYKFVPALVAAALVATLPLPALMAGGAKTEFGEPPIRIGSKLPKKHEDRPLETQYSKKAILEISIGKTGERIYLSPTSPTAGLLPKGDKYQVKLPPKKPSRCADCHPQDGGGGGAGGDPGSAPGGDPGSAPGGDPGSAPGGDPGSAIGGGTGPDGGNQPGSGTVNSEQTPAGTNTRAGGQTAWSVIITQVDKLPDDLLDLDSKQAVVFAGRPKDWFALYLECGGVRAKEPVVFVRANLCEEGFARVELGDPTAVLPQVPLLQWVDTRRKPIPRETEGDAAPDRKTNKK